MNILLVGEYSRLHNSLKEGLIKLGHSVTIIGTGDQFKKYPVDFDISSTFFNSFLLKKIKNFIYLTTRIDLSGIEKSIRYNNALKTLKDIDICQFINEESLKTGLRLEKLLIQKTIKKSKKTFLLSCGTDHISVKYAYDKKFKYSILTPYFEIKKITLSYKYVLKYIHKRHRKHHLFFYNLIDGVIATDIDYHIPLIDHPKYLGLIPNPINIKNIGYLKPVITNKISIFHGVNKANYHKKGNYLFDEALAIIKQKYPDKVTIQRTENVPYSEYIKSYNSCHILLDQVYAYDQGYNALEAMAKGKVVFTGAEKEFLDHYNLQEDMVCINALPNINSLVDKLEMLILNPSIIKTISKNAREFVTNHHDYLKISEKYLQLWQNTKSIH